MFFPYAALKAARAGYRANTLAWVAAGGSASATTLAAMDAFDVAVASIRTKFIRVNLQCGSALASALRPQYLGDGTTNWGNTTDTNTNYRGTEEFDNATWPGRSYFQGDYQETGPNGGLDQQRWGYVGSGYSPPEITTATGLVTNALGTNNIAIGCWFRDNVVSKWVTSASQGTGAPNSGWPKIDSQSAGNLSFFWGGYGAADYLNYATTFGTGFVFGSRVASNDNKLYRNGSQVATGGATSSAQTNNATAMAANHRQVGATAGYAVTKGLTSGEHTTLYNAIAAFNTTLSRVGPYRQAVFLGDSITAGFGGVKPYWQYLYNNATTGAGWAYEEANSGNWGNLRIRVRAWNGAGMGLTSDTNGSVGAADTYLSALQPDGTFFTKTIYFLFAGTNDLGNGTSATTIWNGTATNGMKKFIQNRLAENVNNYVYVIPPLPRSDTNWSSGKETQRLALITLMATDMPAGNAVYCFDLASFPAPDSTYGVTPVDASYYQADKLHPSVAGNVRLSELVFANNNGP